jgi:hypothetical protein
LGNEKWGIFGGWIDGIGLQIFAMPKECLKGEKMLRTVWTHSF